MAYTATFYVKFPDNFDFIADEAERTIIKALHAEAFPALSVAYIDEDHDEEDSE